MATSFTFNEIHQQPAMWRKELETLLKAKAEISAFMHKYLTPDTDIVLTGAGTSAFIGDALLPVMRGLSVKWIFSATCWRKPAMTRMVG